MRVTVWVSFAILFPVVPDVLSGEVASLYAYYQVLEKKETIKSLEGSEIS